MTEKDKETKQPQPPAPEPTTPEPVKPAEPESPPEAIDAIAPVADPGPPEIEDTVPGDAPEGVQTPPAAPEAVPPAHADEDEEEIYEVPPKLTTGDIAGVFIALVALAVIGVAGYIWLTPGLTFSGLFQRGPAAGPAATTTVADDAGETPAADELRCDYCNMYVDRSASTLFVEWSDGSSTSHDSWDCAFNTARERGLKVRSAQVVDFSTFGGAGNPQWLDAAQAAYLYDAANVPGSMPPYVAAFTDAAAARSAQADLGGELLDYAGLLAAFGYVAEEPGTAAEIVPTDPEPNVHTEPIMDTPEPVADPPAVADDPAAHDHDLACPYCGMPADSSLSHIEAIWADGTHTHHDSFDCLFLHAADNGQELASARVLAFDPDGAAAQWLAAAGAWYLYDTQRIKGSMPPYVAAFSSHDAAAVAQPELGGEILDFDGLKARWDQ